jgi:hypothetical protein
MGSKGSTYKGNVNVLPPVQEVRTDRDSGDDRSSLLPDGVNDHLRASLLDDAVDRVLNLSSRSLFDLLDDVLIGVIEALGGADGAEEVVVAGGGSGVDGETGEDCELDGVVTDGRRTSLLIWKKRDRKGEG